MVNKVILIGNLGKDPEIKHFENGGVIARFPLATNENYRDKNGEWQTITDWHNVVLRGNAAERSEKYLQKGNTVFIEGKIRTRKWQDSNGSDHYTTEVVAHSYKSIGNKKDGQDSFNQISNSPESGSSIGNPENNSADNPVDDLPF